MKAESAWKASLFVIAALSSACGEAPTTAGTGSPGESGARLSLSTARHALTCSEDDTLPPALSITDQDIVYECTGTAVGNVWAAPEVTAVDACDGPVPVHKYNTGDDDGDGFPGSEDPDDFGPGPTTEAVGEHLVQYAAWDAHDNIQTATLVVHVQDTFKPVLWLNGPQNIQQQCFRPTDDPTDPDTDVEVDWDPYIEQGAMAEDQCEGDLTAQVRITGEVNKQIPGVYTLEYDVEDSSHNPADPITRSVETIDNTAPKVAGPRSIRLPLALGTMQEVNLSQCAVAWDLCDGYMDIDAIAYNLRITSNDPGNDADDIQLLSNSRFAVRVRHNANGSRRVYKAEFRIDDSSWNYAEGTCTLYVPLVPGEPIPPEQWSNP